MILTLLGVPSRSESVGVDLIPAANCPTVMVVKPHLRLLQCAHASSQNSVVH